MNRWLTVAFMFLVFEAVAAPTSKKKDQKPNVDVSFGELLIQGNYYFSNESVVTVEEEKVLSGLLKTPENFDDRIKKTKKMH